MFGCPTYYHIKNDKFNPRARKTIFMRIKCGVKSFKLWDLESKKFVYNKNATFDEASILNVSNS